MSWGYPASRVFSVFVPLCFMMCRCEPLRSSGYGHMADGIGAEQAVHHTACSWISMARVLGEGPARLPVGHCETHSDSTAQTKPGSPGVGS